jgi:hypothetical protein
MFEPTAKRIVILIMNAIRITQNADLALWLPLSATDSVLRDLRWEETRPGAGEKFLALAVETFRDYADHLLKHLLAWSAWEGGGRRGNPPVFPPWTDADALRMYQTIDRRYPSQAPAATYNRTILRDMLLLVLDETGLPGAGADLATMTDAEIQQADEALTAVIAGWSESECEQAAAWASNVHLLASDNVLPVVERPTFIPGPDRTPPVPEIFPEQDL